MTPAGEDICARCENLTTVGYPEQMAAGKGRCTGYDVGFAQLRDPIVAWNLKSCVHFARAPDQEARTKWIEKQQAKQNNNEVQSKTGESE